MPRLSKLLEKIEDLAANRWGSWYERNKARVPCGSERNPYFT